MILSIFGRWPCSWPSHEQVEGASQLSACHDLANLPEKLGITPDTHVVVYDTVGVFSAPRGVFTFKCE